MKRSIKSTSQILSYHSMALHSWLLIRNHLIANMEKIVAKVKKQKNLQNLSKKIVSDF